MIVGLTGSVKFVHSNY